MAAGDKKPLYNPELETGFEREGDTINFSIGISQTIDWWDKRETKTQLASFSLIQANKHIDYLVQEKTAQALQALMTWQAAKKQSSIALQQEEQLDTLLELVTKCKQPGDLGDGLSIGLAWIPSKLSYKYPMKLLVIFTTDFFAWCFNQ